MGEIHRTPDATIAFYPIRRSTWRDEDGFAAFTRLDSDDSVMLDGWRIEALTLLQQGQTVGETAAALNVAVDDVYELIAFCADVNFIEAVNGEPLDDTAEPIRPWFPHTPRHYFSWVLAKPLVVGSFLFVLSGLVLAATHPAYIPTFHHFFWTDDLFIVALSLVVMDSVTGFIHELAHLTTTRAAGGQARIRFFDNRFLDLVAVTESYHLVLVPKVLRYYVYLSGMLWDFIIVSALVWVLYLSDVYRYDLGLVRNFSLAVILLKLQGILWQFNVYLETDVYNFLADYFNQHNLYTNTKRLIGARIANWKTNTLRPVKQVLERAFLTRDVIDQADNIAQFSQEEKRKHLWYAGLVCFGLLFSLVNLALLQLPRDGIFLWESGRQLLTSVSALEGIGAAKALVVILIVLYRYLGVGIVMYAKIRSGKSFI